jgi:meromycolic acid (3R)-3-hydroxyacyl-[acyl-carrier protein] dehydratase HadB
VRDRQDVTVGEELADLRRIVTREDVAAYAEVSGDRNPLHKDDAFARSVGFPGVIVHGMFTMGHMAAAVVAWAGDPAAVLSVSAQFRAVVFPGDTIVAGGRVRAVDPDEGIATLETWVALERDGHVDRPVKKGAARVRLD